MGLEGLQHVLEHVKPSVLFHLGPIPIKTTVFNTWIVMAIFPPGIFLTAVNTFPGSANLLEI